jgi:hypothetical protein
MKRLRAIAWRTALALGAWTWGSCAPSGFRDETLVQEVRILASSANPPYATPGAGVDVSVLAYDGRATQPEPMNVYWLPFVCEDPPNDAYYACFQQLEGTGGAGADAGADMDAGAGALGKIGPGVDLTPFLPSGPTFHFQMPPDAVTAHNTVSGSDPYGLAILFNVACAGHLELVPVDPSNVNPQTVPIGCFDQNHNQLGPDDWVFGFTRVYAYPADSGVTNTNPVIGGVDVEGQPLGIAPGLGQGYLAETLTSSRCTANSQSDCPHVHIGPVVPSSSQESYTLNGNATREEIWADFYATFGKLDDAARLLYDVGKGSEGDPSVTDNQWSPPSDAGDGTIWIIVRDNRGGASWVTVPVHVQ